MFVSRRIPPLLASRLRAGLSNAHHLEQPIGRLRVQPSTTSAIFTTHSLWSGSSDVEPIAKTLTSNAEPTQVDHASVEERTIPALQDFQEGLRIALDHDQYDVASVLLQQLTKIYSVDSASRLTVFHDFLKRDDLDQFDPAALVSVFNLIKSSPFEVKQLQTEGVFRFLSREGVDTSAFAAGFDCIMAHLSTLQTPSGVNALDFKPPAAVGASFKLTRDLVSDDPQRSLALFDLLVDTGNVPAECLPGEEAMENADIKFVVLSSLSKASIHWGWFLAAARFTLDLLDPKAKENPFIPLLAIETLASLLDGPVQRQPLEYMNACFELIEESHAIQPVPDNLIVQFYKVAKEYDQGAAAEKLYGHSVRHRHHAPTHPYPLPPNSTLGWLMQHLSTSSQQLDLLRCLASDVARRPAILPPAMRPGFIAATASAGNASLARSLWEAYSRGKERHLVFASPKLLVPMVRLFAMVVKQKDKQLERAEAESQTRRRNGPSRPGKDPAILRQDRASAQGFLDRLLDEYERCHHPISRASHFVFTTYVQACFVAGHHEEGLALMQALTERAELPDRHDINVMLNGIALRDPRQAVRVLNQMTESKRLSPDTTTYGTIMTRALDHRDFELVDDMIDLLVGPKARFKVPRFTLKSVAGILRALAFSRPEEPMEDRAARLRRAMSILEEWMTTNNSTSAQMGIFLSKAALQVGDPAMAFKFWDLMVRQAVRFRDIEHTQLRVAIANLVESHGREGSISTEEQERMLGLLERKSRNQSVHS
ncbi:hypothetical protein CC1G_02935 [Coprinopsis cinerea okayama7|uniref:Pentatricopeptide repeat protein n=1 Tax=Coprinopsis cinerea (strain Okayama-7 / 130 / ATCC MYA-4618 / FGSC 9003) TaxID=240176 RepID=A8NRT0_COPC7|nr:hypothetical protein CC1G_02935 [Coprinopsis cinerea okayama7\|eukprot:XP_001835847.1 hypothetical protein CC1G_02935 [Coprinopsis cinerea okayama7\